MKWTLLLFFLLIFAVSLPVGRDSFFKKEPILSSQRFPASEQSSCYDLLASFYSDERNAILPERIKNASDDIHLFYRSFPPLFYKLAEECKWRDHFGSVSSYLSVMAGDAHMENFGLKFFNGKLRLSVNDYDDLTYGPPFLDFLRLLSSARLAGLEVDEDLIKESLKSYSKGLKGKEWTYSDSTLSLIKQSKNSAILDNKKIDLQKKIFIKKKEPYSSLSEAEKKQWQTALSDFGEMKDSYLFIKQYGGSAGLKRYQFLMEKNGELKWIEAKEWDRPSYNTASETKSPSDFKRYEAITTYDRPYVKPVLSKINSKTFYIRNIDGRQIGVAIADLKKEELRKVLLDEVYALGDFHQTFLKNKNDYIKTMDDFLNVDDIKDFVTTMKKEMKETLKQLH